jgi:type I restriction enzyme M protein
MAREKKEKTTTKKTKSFEETLWDSANKLRGSVEFGGHP